MIKINTIYIDILFLVNLAINTGIIMCTGYIMKLPRHPIRVLASAAEGAAYSCLMFVCNLSAVTSMAIRLCFAALMIVTAFGTCSVRALLKRTAVFILLTVAQGIAMLAVLYFTKAGIRLGGVIKNGVFYFNIPAGYMIICSIGAYILIHIAEKLIKRTFHRSFARIKLKHLGKTVELKALIDTGNMLRDPLSGKKVLIAEAQKLTPLFEFDLRSISPVEPNGLPRGFRLIPFSSIGKENGLLAAFVPDAIEVEDAEQKDIIAAVFDGTLSQNGDYDALIGP